MDRPPVAERLTIGEVAAVVGVATSTLRYYERRRLVVADERVSGQRRYGWATVRMAERRILHPHVCCACRVSFRYPADVAPPPCPECGRTLVRLDRKFSVPPRRATAQWAKVAFLIEHGFDFRRVYERDGRALRSVAYPATLAAAHRFVERPLVYADGSPVTT